MSRCLIKPAVTGPCPFCRSTLTEIVHPTMSTYAVRCTACQAQGPGCVAKQDAVGAWKYAGRVQVQHNVTKRGTL